jgi:hypothetical protein
VSKLPEEIRAAHLKIVREINAFAKGAEASGGLTDQVRAARANPAGMRDVLSAMRDFNGRIAAAIRELNTVAAKHGVPSPAERN